MSVYVQSCKAKLKPKKHLKTGHQCVYVIVPLCGTLLTFLPSQFTIQTCAENSKRDTLITLLVLLPQMNPADLPLCGHPK